MKDNKGLLNKTDEVETDKSAYKIIVLAVIGIIFSFLFGYFLKFFISTGDWNFLLFSFLASIGLGIFFLLNVFFIKTFWRAYLIIFLEILALLIGFYDQFSIVLGLTALVSFLILIAGHSSGYSELRNMLSIKFWRISKVALPKLIGVLIFFSVAAYINNVQATISTKEGFFISSAAFEKIVFLTTPLIQKFLPEFNPFLKVEELFVNLAKKQIEQEPQLKLLSENYKKQLINQATKELEQKVSEFIKAPFNSKAKVSEAVYEAMVYKFKTFPHQIKTIILISIGVLIFLTIAGLALPFRWLITILAFVIYEFLLITGFAIIAAESRSREIIVLK
jgi:hypothetical protein